MVFVPPGVVTAVLALFKERQEQQSETDGAEANQPENCISADIGAAAFAWFTVKATFL